VGRFCGYTCGGSENAGKSTIIGWIEETNIGWIEEQEWE